MQDKFFEEEEIKKIVEDYYIEDGNCLISKESVLSALKPGHAVKTFIKSTNTWDVNVVLNISEQNILIPFKDKYIEETMMVNDLVKCCFTLKNYNINLLCVIKNIFLTSLPTMLLKVLRIDLKKNIRSSQRYEVKYIGKIELNLRDEMICYISDISMSGIRITTKEQLVMGKSLKLTIIANSSPSVMCSVVNIRDRRLHDDKIVYGLKYNNLSSVDEEKIKSIIDYIEVSEYDSITSICKSYGIL